MKIERLRRLDKERLAAALHYRPVLREKNYLVSVLRSCVFEVRVHTPDERYFFPLPAEGAERLVTFFIFGHSALSPRW